MPRYNTGDRVAVKVAEVSSANLPDESKVFKDGIWWVTAEVAR